MKKSKRLEILEAADLLFYERGFEHTSFADIAAAVGISRGNFYYHFKSKDEILDGVIALRLQNREFMLQNWEMQGETPLDRICSFIKILLVNGEKIKKYGCPIGTLSTELAKLNHASFEEANGLFTLFRTWLVRQFELMGHGKDSDSFAMHLLARSQGVATLANAFRDDAFIHKEVAAMCIWAENPIIEGGR